MLWRRTTPSTTASTSERLASRPSSALLKPSEVRSDNTTVLPACSSDLTTCPRNTSARRTPATILATRRAPGPPNPPLPTRAAAEPRTNCRTSVPDSSTRHLIDPVEDALFVRRIEIVRRQEGHGQAATRADATGDL